MKTTLAPLAPFLSLMTAQAWAGPVPADGGGAVWSVSVDQSESSFGNAVAAGDVNGDGYDDLVVGAFQYDSDEVDDGRVFLYLGGATGPATTAAWEAWGDHPGGSFGYSLAVADLDADGFDDLIVGAPTARDTGTRGRLYVYPGGPGGLPELPSAVLGADRDEVYFGFAIASAGDTNGDGYEDVVVGSPASGDAIAAAAHLFLGSPDGLVPTAPWTVNADQGTAFGSSVCGVGDVDADGYADVVVGASDQGANEAGRALLYRGSSEGLTADPASVLESDQAFANLGDHVAPAGDVNGDGFADLIVSALGYDNSPDRRGRTFLYVGGPAGLVTTAVWSVADQPIELRAAGHVDVSPHDSPGLSVSGVGDLDGDGFADVMVGSAGFGISGSLLQGGAYMYQGSASGPSAEPDLDLEHHEVYSYFGEPVAPAGDVNGDGYPDVVIGAPGGSDSIHPSKVYLYFGSADGLVVPMEPPVPTDPGTTSTDDATDTGSETVCFDDCDPGKTCGCASGAPGGSLLAVGVSLLALLRRSAGRRALLAAAALVASACGSPTSDADGDGLTQQQEEDLGLDPEAFDTDGDGLSDGDELGLGTDPLLPDTDADHLLDGDEADNQADPLIADTDGDEYLDGDEVLEGHSPADPDDRIYVGNWPYYYDKDSIEVNPATAVAFGARFLRMALVDQFGDTVDLFDFYDAGKPVIIDVAAEWCPPCVELGNWLAGNPEPAMSALWPAGQDAIARGDLWWITILTEDLEGLPATPAAATGWAEQFPAPYVTVVADGKYAAANYTRVSGWPAVVLLDTDLIVQDTRSISVDGVLPVLSEMFPK